MRLAAIADLHLGFAAGRKLTKSGVNQRTEDVSRTFSRVIDRVIELQPDVVTVAGDVFHQVRPRNGEIVHAMREFGRLTRALPNTPVCISAGNHDLSKEGETCVLKLLEHVGCYVAAFDAMRFDFPDRSLSVLCVPDAPSTSRPALTPNPDARYNILCLHGEVMGVKQGGADRRTNLKDVSPGELGAEQWSFVALGHYHQFEALAANVAYSGAIDFTSSNPWQEIATPKGFIVYDLGAHTRTFEEVEPVRRFIDCQRLDVTGMGVEDADAAIADALSAIDLEGSCVRLVVEGITRDIKKGLNQKAMRSYVLRATTLTIDYRRSDPLDFKALDAKIDRRIATVFDRVMGKLDDLMANPEFPSDVDKSELKTLAGKYLELAAEKETRRAPDAPIAPYDGLTLDEARQYAAEDQAYETRLRDEREARKLTKQLETSLQRSA